MQSKLIKIGAIIQENPLDALAPMAGSEIEYIGKWPDENLMIIGRI